MTNLKILYASIVGAIVLFIAVISGGVGAYFARRKADKELDAQEAEIRKQRKLLNESANQAALKALQSKVTKTNEAANDITSNLADIINKLTR